MSENIPGLIDLEIDQDQRIEVLPFDLSAAYANLAPLITEAHAYMECGNTAKGWECIAEARKMIERNTMMMYAVCCTNVNQKESE